MRLTILGSSASYSGPGQACAGYLVEEGDTGVLVDCGNGVVSNLGLAVDPLTVSAVFVSHLHIDHFADLFPLQALLRYAPSGPAPALPLHGPAGLMDWLTCPMDERGAGEMRDAFEFAPLVAGVPVEVGALTLTPVEMPHVPGTFGLTIEGATRRIFYTSDTRFDRAVVSAAAGADVLLADATMPPQYAGRAPHMTPEEAATVALHAGVGTLVLTHLWPTLDREEALRDAEAVFAGHVLIAEEMLALDLG